MMPIITPCPLSLPKEAFWILRISSMDKEYILNPDASVAYEGIEVLTPAEVAVALNFANNALRELSDTTMRFDINICAISVV